MTLLMATSTSAPVILVSTRDNRHPDGLVSKTPNFPQLFSSVLFVLLCSAGIMMAAESAEFRSASEEYMML